MSDCDFAAGVMASSLALDASYSGLTLLLVCTPERDQGFPILSVYPTEGNVPSTANSQILHLDTESLRIHYCFQVDGQFLELNESKYRRQDEYECVVGQATILATTLHRVLKLFFGCVVSLYAQTDRWTGTKYHRLSFLLL